MGTPWMGFMQDEFNWGRKKGAWSFGLITLILGLPTVLFFNEGVFDEYDYWAGTVSLVVFALAEIILFAWVFGMTKGWKEINAGSDIKLPQLYKPIIKYVTPVILLIVFLGALITPKNNDWVGAFKNGWELDKGSILSKITNSDIETNKNFFADYKEFDLEEGIVSGISKFYDDKKDVHYNVLEVSNKQTFYVNQQGIARPTAKRELLETLGKNYTFIEDSMAPAREYKFTLDKKLIVKVGDELEKGQKIATGKFINRSFYITLGRLLLLALFLFICFLVYRAGKNRKTL
jgi:hypothetical protein